MNYSILIIDSDYRQHQSVFITVSVTGEQWLTVTANCHLLFNPLTCGLVILPYNTYAKSIQTIYHLQALQFVIGSFWSWQVGVRYVILHDWAELACKHHSQCTCTNATLAMAHIMMIHVFFRHLFNFIYFYYSIGIRYIGYAAQHGYYTLMCSNHLYSYF